MRGWWGLHLSDNHHRVSEKEITKAVGVKSCREAVLSNHLFQRFQIHKQSEVFFGHDFDYFYRLKFPKVSKIK